VSTTQVEPNKIRRHSKCLGGVKTGHYSSWFCPSWFCAMSFLNYFSDTGFRSTTKNPRAHRTCLTYRPVVATVCFGSILAVKMKCRLSQAQNRQMSDLSGRGATAVLSSGCESHLSVFTPAGSNRSSRGGGEGAETPVEEGHWVTCRVCRQSPSSCMCMQR